MNDAPLWVNALFSVGQFYGASTLLPMLLGRGKPSLITSLMVVVPQPLYVVAYAVMGMPAAAGMATLLGVMWSILLVQGFQARSSSPETPSLAVHHGVPGHANILVAVPMCGVC